MGSISKGAFVADVAGVLFRGFTVKAEMAMDKSLDNGYTDPIMGWNNSKAAAVRSSTENQFSGAAHARQ